MSNGCLHAAGLRPSPRPSRSGFTLLEILIAAAIIALIVAILLPSFSRAGKQTRRTICKAYQYQLTFTDKCGSARLKLDAFDCGCYTENDKDLYAFRLPPEVTADLFRHQLESDVIESCRSKPGSKEPAARKEGV